jgi:hypothetical protein
MPATRGLLRIGSRSPDSEFGHVRPGIANSLRSIFEIFPFSGDGGRRTGFDLDCVAGAAVQPMSNICSIAPPPKKAGQEMDDDIPF